MQLAKIAQCLMSRRYCSLRHCHLTLTDCEVQGIGIGGTGDESCSGPCTPQASDGGSKKRESQAASDPTNHVAIGLVLLQCEQRGKAFVENSCLLAHASGCGKDQRCKASSFNFPDSYYIFIYIYIYIYNINIYITYRRCYA